MRRRTLTLVSNPSAGRVQPTRLTRDEFFDRMQPYIDKFSFLCETLDILSSSFVVGGRVMIEECEGVIECAIEISHVCSQLKELIKRPDIPLALLPIRLPLLTALIDASASVAKLEKLLYIFLDRCSTSLVQPTEERIEIASDLNALQGQIEQILAQVKDLKDQARFQEQKYSLI